MKTQTKPIPSSKTLLLLAAFGLASTTLAAPAMAHGNRYTPPPVNTDGNMYNNNRNMYNNRNTYNNNIRAQYPWLNRINRYGVRGKIVKWGRGPYSNCFRVKRTGRYQGESAIVTVRYCQDHYGQARIVRGSKYLVRYIGMYRSARGYGSRPYR